jgi:leader peptidase (prepilin peptidase)/N-methyltransferase
MIAATVWWTWQFFAIAVSLVMGSFVSLCITRMPEDRSIITPGSHCDMCGQPVQPRDNIPVISWILLKGRCRDCDASIPVTYPLTELFVALLGWLLFRKLVPDADAIDVAHGVAWVVYFGFLCALTIAAFVDMRHRIIPDETSIYAIPFGVGGAWLLEYLQYDGWLGFGLAQSATGAVAAYAFLGSLAIVAHFTMGPNAMGWGDVKLIAMIGAFLGGFPGAFFVLMFGSMVGSVVGLSMTLYLWRRPILPFGPSLTLVAGLYVFYGDILIENYLTMWLWAI